MSFCDDLKRKGGRKKGKSSKSTKKFTNTAGDGFGRKKVRNQLVCLTSPICC